jgi:hypothetical protein
MKNVLAIILFLLLVLTVQNGGAQVFNPPGGIPAPGSTDADHPLIKAYVIELKHLSPEQAVEMLQGEGSRFKAFIPKEITEINALPNSQKLLIQTTDAQAAIRLTQIISLIDQPGRLALQAMLIIVSPPEPEGERQSMPAVDGKTPFAPETVQKWVQSLIDTYRGSVVLFSDQPVVSETRQIHDRKYVNFHPTRLTMPSFVMDISGIVISSAMPDQSSNNWMFHQPAGERIQASVAVAWHGGSALTDPPPPPTSSLQACFVTLMIDKTTLLSLDGMRPLVFKDGAITSQIKTDKHYFLAIMPKILPPTIPEPGLLPTVGGAAYPGTGTYPPDNVPVGIPGMIPPASNR